MSSINDIQISVPANTVELEYFKKILEMCKNVSIVDENSIKISSSKKLKPTISFVTETINNPSVSFITNTHLEKESFWVDKLPVGFNLKKTSLNSKISEKPIVANTSDSIGDYLKVKWSNATYSQLNFKQLYNRITNKLLYVDHVGININPRLLSKEKYEKMKKMVADRTYLSDYPYGREWPFIIPTSLAERKHKVETGINRDPKFEFVYDFAYPYPEIQLDIQTSLPPKDILGLFPQPYGYYDETPITGDYCSSVFIYTGWANVSLRIDLRFYITAKNLTDSLLNEGQRV
jgi:hypothetical protein